MEEILVNEDMAIELFDKLDSITLLLSVIAFLLCILIIYLFLHYAVNRG